MCATACYFRDDFPSIGDQLLFDVAVDMNPIILFLAEMDVGDVNKDCWQVFLSIRPIYVASLPLDVFCISETLHRSALGKR